MQDKLELSQSEMTSLREWVLIIIKQKNIAKRVTDTYWCVFKGGKSPGDEVGEE